MKGAVAQDHDGEGDLSACCSALEHIESGQAGIRIYEEISQDTAFSESRGSKSGNTSPETIGPGAATGSTVAATRDPHNPAEHSSNATPTTPLDADLAQVLAAWPTLPAPLRAAVMALVGSAKP